MKLTDLRENEPCDRRRFISNNLSVLLAFNGEQLPGLFITIVRYVLPSEDHAVQKLLLLYLILICQNLRNNLQHPNEYLRGVTLRFLCRIKEEEILEPLVPSVLTNLEHRHSYVRRNAVLAINCIYKLPKEALSTGGDILQMGVLELIRKVCRTSPTEKGKSCRTSPTEKGKCIKIILALLQSSSSTVVFEGAVTLVSLSQAPSAIRAAANCLTQLLVSVQDNNVKLIVLDRLQELKDKHRDVMADVVMDIMRALSTPNMDIKKKTLDISMDLITKRNIDEVVMVLKKEIVKTQNKDYEKFPDVASNVVHLLMDFMGDNSASALDVVFFVRDIMETHADLRSSILERLRDTFSQIQSPRVCCCALWILGEYSVTPEDMNAAMDVIKQSLGPTPFLTVEGEERSEAPAPGSAPAPSQTAGSRRPAVLADGTYATQTAVVEAPIVGLGMSQVPNLRSILLGGDFFLACVIASTMTKLVLRLQSLGTESEPMCPISFLACVMASTMTKLVLCLQSLGTER
eukprot:gene27157-2393_t